MFLFFGTIHGLKYLSSSTRDSTLTLDHRGIPRNILGYNLLHWEEKIISKLNITHAHTQRLSCAWLSVCSLPGFSVHGISQTRILQWAAIPPPGYLPNPGIELKSFMSPALQAVLYHLRHHTQVEEEGLAQKTSSEWLFSRVKLYGIWWSSSVQSFSHVWLFVTPWTAARQASLSITNTQSLLKLMSINLVMPSNHLILCHPFVLLPSIFPSISHFQWVSSSHQVAKVLEFQIQHQSFQWSFKTDFL